MKVKITDFVNHIPVHVVLVIDKHLPETNLVWPSASTNMCKDFSYRSTSNKQNSFRSPLNNSVNIILGLSELFSSTGTNAKARKQCWKIGGVKHGCKLSFVLAPYGASNPVGASITYEIITAGPYQYGICQIQDIQVVKIEVYQNTFFCLNFIKLCTE